MRFTIHDQPATAPHRPATRAGVVRIFNGYAAPGVAAVNAWPHRPMSHARAIARRIARDPAAYIDIILTFDLPGIDIDPTAGAFAA